MMIADAQVHVWAADTPERPWPKDRPAKPQRPVPFSPDDLLREMDAAGVERAVLVPPSWEGDRNDLALAASQAHPRRLATMGRLLVDQLDAREAIRSWRKQPGMLGARFTFRMGGEISMLTEPSYHWVWSEFEEAGVPVMLYPPGLLDHVAAIAERHPGIKIILDHLAFNRVKGAAAWADLPDLLALAKWPNIAVKASALPFYSGEDYPYRNVHEAIRRARDAFGPRRVFWGTDLTRLPCTYRQAITMFTEELPWLTEDEKEWIMGRGLCEWLGWRDDGSIV